METKQTKQTKQTEKKKIDWLITLLPLGLIVVLCILFFFKPEQSNQVLSQIRYLVIHLELIIL